MDSSIVDVGGAVSSVENKHFLLSAETVSVHAATISAAMVKNLETNIVMDANFNFISYRTSGSVELARRVRPVNAWQRKLIVR